MEIQVNLEDDHSALYLYGAIGDEWEGFTDKDLLRALAEAHADKPIHLHINSEGGSVIEGYAMYNTLRRDSRAVVSFIDGAALSAASYVALAGGVRETASESIWMAHNPMGFVFGDYRDAESLAKVLHATQKQIAQIYDRHTDHNVAEWLEMMDAETWFTADEAKSVGLATAVSERPAKMANFVTTHLKNPPKEIRAKFKPAPEKLDKGVQFRLAAVRIRERLASL